MYREGSDILPELLDLSSYIEDCDFIDYVYEVFKHSLIDNLPTFMGNEMRLKRLPLSEGKEATFWHMISEGEDEANRVISRCRAERIEWPAAIIKAPQHSEIKMWKNRRGNKRNILLYHQQEKYLVVLRENRNYIMPWTAYPITYDNAERRLLREYQSYINSL